MTSLDCGLRISFQHSAIGNSIIRLCCVVQAVSIGLLFGVVHGDVGSLEERFDILSMSRIQADPDTGGDEEFPVIKDEGLSEDIQDLPRNNKAVLSIRQTLEDEHKLIACQPGDRIVFTYTTLQPLRHRFQHQITLCVPQGIVDPLEMIQIEHHDSDDPSTTLGPRQGLIQTVLEQLPVRQGR